MVITIVDILPERVLIIEIYCCQTLFQRNNSSKECGVLHW